jgi:rod shape-determining protein MreC
VLALLVGVSLILLTAYFGESPSSPLHSVQRGIVEVISPVQDVASKALKPFRDVAGWFSDTFKAKSQVAQLKTEVQDLRSKLAVARQQAINDAQLSRLVGLDNQIGINAMQPVAGHVIGRDPTLWYQTIEVDKGSDDGVRLNDPVIGDKGLVGKVTTVDATVSFVTLLTDHSFGVAAIVQDAKGDAGVLVPKIGDPNQLLLQDLQPPGPGQPGPALGQLVVTAGFKDPSGALTSLYPQGIPIGIVSNANQDNLINNHQIQVAPLADLRRLDFVQILTNPHAVAGTRRAQLP